jgi:hypothetical protein
VKSLRHNLLSLSTNVVGPLVVLLAFATATVSIPACAQDTWQIDPKSSVATLSLGAGAKTLQIGLARVRGQVEFESGDPSDPIVAFKISAGSKVSAESASMSFTSKSSALTADGKLKVIGDLSLIRVERSVTMEPNEAYAGPQYGDPATYTNTRQVTVVFSDPHGLASQSGVMHFLGTSTVSREDFPQFLDALTSVDWPTQLINDEKCKIPSTIGEDYHGADCTGTVIANVSNEVVSTGAPSGEGFYGFEPVISPERNKATISLDLKLEEMSASPSISR